MEYSCGNCLNRVVAAADVSFRKNPNKHQHTSSFWMDLRPEAAWCNRCGIWNEVHDHCLRLVSKFEPESPSGEVENSGLDEANGKLFAPCPQCGEKLEVYQKFTANRTHPWSDVRVQECIQCDSCSSIVEWSGERSFRIMTEYR